MAEKQRKYKHAWQVLEQRIAKFFNSVRSPFSGSNSGETSSDSLHPRLYIECKNHKGTAILNLMRDTEVKAKEEGKTPIVVLGDPEDLDKNIYVLFNLDNFKEIVKEVDLSEISPNFKQGETLKHSIDIKDYHSVELIEIRNILERKMKSIMKEKVISNQGLEDIKAYATISYFVDTIMDYIKNNTKGNKNV